MTQNAKKPSLVSPPIIIQRENGQLGAIGQCDCACTSFFPTFVEEPCPVGHHVALSTTPVALGNGYQAIQVSTLQANPVILNHSALALVRCFDAGYSLDEFHQAWGEEVVQYTLERLTAVGLLMPESHIAPQLPQIPITLAAWLHLITACNLACDYCYLPKSSTNMSPDTGHDVIDAVFRSALAHGYRTVKLKYAGGEPLLVFPLVVELHRYAQSLARRSGLAIDGVVLSNGTLLTPEMVETMQALNLRLMISLDGLGEFHNCQRYFADGHGSFESVARSIDLALSQGLVPEISVTVSGRNSAGLPELMSWILERDLPFSLNFYRENDLSASHADLQLEEDRIIEGMLAAYKVIEDNLPHRSLLASLIDRANLATPHLRTCAVGQNYLVFDTQGRVAKCQMDMGTAITDCTDPDPLSTVRASSDGIRNLKVDEKDECKECKWRYWCTGGCPLMAYRKTGRYEAKSPNCEIYKALFPEVIRLEGLRLLKYADGLDEIVVYQPEHLQVGLTSY